MKIDPQKFMLRQLKKEHLEYIVLKIGGVIHGDGVLTTGSNPDYMNFEEWLSEQNLTQDE